MSRIAILTPYALPVRGGISTFVDGMATLLLNRGNAVWIVSGEGDGDQPEHSDLGHGQAYGAKAFRLLKALNPDLVHCHGHGTVLAAGIRYKRWKPRARVVFSVHTTFATPPSTSLRHDLDAADVVTFVSASQLAEVRKTAHLRGELRLLPPATKMRTPPAAEVQRWARDYGIEGKYPVLMFVGPLEYKRKVAGVLDLVEVFRAVKKRHPDARLLVIGDGTMRPQIEQAATDLGEAVRVTGFVPDPLLPLANATLYCHISYQEGLPLALIEAMSLGKCVLASPTGGIPEVIDGTNGRLVSGGPNQIANAVMSLLADPAEVERIGCAGRETVRDAYTWPARLRQLQSIYGGVEV